MTGSLWSHWETKSILSKTERWMLTNQSVHSLQLSQMFLYNNREGWSPIPIVYWRRKVFVNPKLCFHFQNIPDNLSLKTELGLWSEVIPLATNIPSLHKEKMRHFAEISKQVLQMDCISLNLTLEFTVWRWASYFISLCMFRHL